ncbi:MAG TPA: VanZ family protein, partial [Longimicrobium sp.]
ARPSAHPPAPRQTRTPLALSLAAIVLATLTPSASEGAAGWDGCLLCGDRGLADALLNVALFAPLGAVLARRGVRAPLALVLAAALSALVEAAQLGIPGRDPSPPDLLFNALGAAAGYAVGVRMDALLRPSARVAGRLALGWSLAFLAVVAGTGWLTATAPPPGPYVGQWTPRLADHPLLPARILDARIGGVHIPWGRLGPSDSVRAALAGSEPLEARWIVAGRVARPAPLLRVVGAGGDEAAALFIEGEDLVFLRRTRAARLRLDRPALRAPGVIQGVVPGDTVRLRVRMDGRRAWFANDFGWSARDGMGPGRGWALLFSVLSMRGGAARALDGLWLFLWMVPLGLWLRRRRASAVALAIAAAAVAVLPPLASLAPVHVPEALGACGGLLAGAALSRVLLEIRRPLERRAPA